MRTLAGESWKRHALSMVKIPPRASQALAHKGYYGEDLSAVIERTVYLESLEEFRKETSLRVGTRIPFVANDSPEAHMDYVR